MLPNSDNLLQPFLDESIKVLNRWANDNPKVCNSFKLKCTKTLIRFQILVVIKLFFDKIKISLLTFLLKYPIHSNQ